MIEGKREVFKHANIIEEAHHVLSNERRSFIGGQSVMEIAFREIREFGESILILDQSPSSIAHSALANAYCTMFMRYGGRCWKSCDSHRIDDSSGSSL